MVSAWEVSKEVLFRIFRKGISDQLSLVICTEKSIRKGTSFMGAEDIEARACWSL